MRSARDRRKAAAFTTSRLAAPRGVASRRRGRRGDEQSRAAQHVQLSRHQLHLLRQHLLERAGVGRRRMTRDGGNGRRGNGAVGAGAIRSGAGSAGIIDTRRVARACSVEQSSSRSRNETFTPKLLLYRAARLGEEQRIETQLEKCRRRIERGGVDARELGE